MKRHQPLKAPAPETQQGHGSLHATDTAFDFRGPWFNAKTAAAYVPCKTVKAWYVWRVRHGIIARANGSVAKADLDRVLNRRKPRRVMNPVSLANLRRLHASDPDAHHTSTVRVLSDQ